jgi:hypothetical protein
MIEQKDTLKGYGNRSEETLKSGPGLFFFCSGSFNAEAVAIGFRPWRPFRAVRFVEVNLLFRPGASRRREHWRARSRGHEDWPPVGIFAQRGKDTGQIASA